MIKANYKNEQNKWYDINWFIKLIKKDISEISFLIDFKGFY